LGKKQTVLVDEIEDGFTSAGWLLDGSFSEYLVIGYDGDGLSILAAKEAWETDGRPIFELIDHERDLTYGVDEIPTPEQARQTLQEHGLPSEERQD
jgi:hypothetical protein